MIECIDAKKSFKKFGFVSRKYILLGKTLKSSVGLRCKGKKLKRILNVLGQIFLKAFKKDWSSRFSIEDLEKFFF